MTDTATRLKKALESCPQHVAEMNAKAPSLPPSEKKSHAKDSQDLDRRERSRRNKRGRKQPAKVPYKLARTPAFAPTCQNLITDSNFERVYIVPGYSVVKIKGRELGSRHRDALFRMKPERKGSGDDTYFEVRTTWREILILLGKTQHRNNLRTILNLFEHFQMVVIEVQLGKPAKILEADQQGHIGGPGFSENILRSVAWEGDQLDSPVKIQYGAWVREMIERKHLVSLNAEVQFALSSDYAKSFWPFIDSQPDWTYVDEELLAELAGVELWDEEATLEESNTRRKTFRRFCKRAFDDMVKAGGLSSWSVEVTGSGRRKGRRYRYEHALPRQFELGLSTAT